MASLQYEENNLGGVSQMDSWFYGGITLMGVAVLLAVVSIVIFKIKKKKIAARLKDKYGEYI